MNERLEGIDPEPGTSRIPAAPQHAGGNAVMASLLLRLIFLAGLLAWPLAATAQDYPSKPIKFVVPFPAGGPADTFARVLGDKLSTLLGQPVVIENRAGAGGLTGIASVAKSDPDGHTVGIAPSSALAINVNLREHMPFRPLEDFRLITQIVSVPEILVVGEGVPAKSLAELIALAKAQPGKLVFASTGLGGMPHLATELLKLSAGIELVHLPYTGAAPAVNDLLGGHVQMMFADVPVLLGAVQSGKLRALAIGSRVRSPSVPDVPTTAELGMPDVEADNWYGLVVPAATPAPVAAKLAAAAIEALHSTEVKEKLAAQGAIAVGNSSEEFTAYVKSETDRWGKVIAAAGLKIK
jgi:tripartite-type tricarboxylate transporter receptor subunit TctC